MRKTGLKSCNIEKMIQKLNQMLIDNPKDQKLIKKVKRGLEDMQQWRSQQRNEEGKRF